MDRDGVNGVYNRPYESLYCRCFRWLGLWAEWQHVLEYGADALRCTDGQILNGIRNRMVYWLSELALSEYTMDDVREERYQGVAALWNVPGLSLCCGSDADAY